MNYIVDPITNITHSIFTPDGMYVLEKYVQYFKNHQSGGMVYKMGDFNANDILHLLTNIIIYVHLENLDEVVNYLGKEELSGESHIKLVLHRETKGDEPDITYWGSKLVNWSDKVEKMYGNQESILKKSDVGEMVNVYLNPGLYLSKIGGLKIKLFNDLLYYKIAFLKGYSVMKKKIKSYTLEELIKNLGNRSFTSLCVKDIVSLSDNKILPFDFDPKSKKEHLKNCEDGQKEVIAGKDGKKLTNMFNSVSSWLFFINYIADDWKSFCNIRKKGQLYCKCMMNDDKKICEKCSKKYMVIRHKKWKLFKNVLKQLECSGKVKEMKTLAYYERKNKELEEEILNDPKYKKAAEEAEDARQKLTNINQTKLSKSSKNIQSSAKQSIDDAVNELTISNTPNTPSYAGTPEGSPSNVDLELTRDN